MIAPEKNQNQFMMMNNMGMMNPMMMNNDEINFANQNNNLEHPEETDNIKIYLATEENKFEPIIINKNDDRLTLLNKLLSYLKSIGKPLCRRPYPGEVIKRTSPQETLEYLLERGVYENYPGINYILVFL